MKQKCSKCGKLVSTVRKQPNIGIEEWLCDECFKEKFEAHYKDTAKSVSDKLIGK